MEIKLRCFELYVLANFLFILLQIHCNYTIILVS